MTRADKIKMLLKVRGSVELMVAAIFKSIEEEVVKHTVDVDKKKMVEATKLKWEVRSIRMEALRRISKIGRDYED